ncbi:hypothetical protein [Flavobacterium sp.]|uniref:hypothetical protein n=1 Tax=Flavobacterium sp. TaxID=239 RepID=UPI0039E291AB
MKLTSLLFLVCPFYLYAQVGIGTTSPTATLDVNGTLRVRQTDLYTSDTSAKDSVLVVNKIGDVRRVSSKTIVNSYLKTFVKGSFNTSTDKSLTLSSGTQKIPFDYEEFDTNNEFDTSNNTFTAKQAGIYEIGVQIKATSSLSIASNFAVAIVKVITSPASTTVLARAAFANVGVATVNITTPLRATQTLVQLNSGDTIRFNLYSDLVNIGVLGSREDCFFYIHQVR